MNDASTKSMRVLLLALFSLIFLGMLLVTVQASMVRNVLDNGKLLEDPWFIATLMDAYFGFLTFFVWVCWKEPHLLRRVVWFILIMAFGNFAMSAYVILQILKAPSDDFFSHVLLDRGSTSR